MKETDKTDCSNSAPSSVALERNRYFTGKYMAARDFNAEQDFFLSRHHLQNRLSLGWGIACGLVVQKHPEPHCAGRWVLLEPGLAIDSSGREIIVREEVYFELQIPAPFSTLGEDDDDGSSDGYRSEYLLCLRYCEDEVEEVPALYSDGSCSSDGKEANRIRSKYELHLLKRSELPEDCWRGLDSDSFATAIDHEDLDCAQVRRDYLRLPCGPNEACGDYVPVALVRPLEWSDGELSAYELDYRGLKYARVHGDLLTRVEGFNWSHGGLMTLGELYEQDCKLRVRFNRPLMTFPEDEYGRGANEYTFVVEYRHRGSNREILNSKSVHLENCDRDIVFEIPRYFFEDSEHSSHRGRSGLIGTLVTIKLKCDFLPDCFGRAVDGNFLRAALPSGNGVPGGIFESWFRVAETVEPKEYDR